MYLFYSSGKINSKDCEKQPKEILGGKTLLWLHWLHYKNMYG